MGIAFQFFVLFWALPGADWAYSMHSKLFDFSRSEFDLMMYGFMGLVKLIAVVGFFKVGSVKNSCAFEGFRNSNR